MSSKALVIGGANTDIIGFAQSLERHDSNIGRISIQGGGVGRNIAENLRLLGLDVSMMSVFGDDMLSETLKYGLIHKGIDVSRSITIAGGGPCIYMAVIGPDGDMDIAVNDMEPMVHLNRSLLERHIGWINSFDIVVPDANLSRETIEFIVKSIKKPMVFDPVSMAKASRLKDLILGFDTLKLNQYEAMHLTGENDYEHAAASLLGKGAERVFVTCGKEGSYYADRGGDKGFAAAMQVDAVNATGAGDAYTAGVTFGLLMGMGTGECAYFATACAAITVRSESAVNQEISKTAVHEMLGGIHESIHSDKRRSAAGDS